MSVATRHVADVPALAPLYAKAVLAAPLRRPDATPSSHWLSAREQAVDRDRLTEFQKLCGYPVSDVLPPTYLHLLAFPLSVARMVESDFPFPLLGLVHVRNVLRHRRPVGAAERVTVSVRAGEVTEHRSGRQIELVSRASVGDQIVWDETSTYLHRQPSSGYRADRPVATSEPAAPGERAQTALWSVGADVGRAYAAVSGDRNPIHLWPLTARAFGFPRAIAHGMWSTARLLAMFESRLPADFGCDVTFRAPILLPSRVAVRSTPTSTGWHSEVLATSASAKPHLSADIAGA